MRSFTRKRDMRTYHWGGRAGQDKINKRVDNLAGRAKEGSVLIISKKRNQGE